MTGSASNQQLIVNALEDDACLTIDALEETIGITRKQIAKAAIGLIRHQFIERVELGCYQLTTKGKEAKRAGLKLKSGPRGKHTGFKKGIRNTLKQRAWDTMPTLKKFTAQDLLAVAVDGTEKSEAAALDNIQKFIRLLVGMGYLRLLPIRQRDGKPNSNGLKRFLLLKHTGAIAPRPKGLVKDNTGLDPNTRELIKW